jgi:hypothetical protein
MELHNTNIHDSETSLHKRELYLRNVKGANQTFTAADDMKYCM